MQETRAVGPSRCGTGLALHHDMLVRYCATHVRHFGYPRLLGVRWNGRAIATVGGLCEACRERERNRWEATLYGDVLIPAPVELGPRMLVRRVVVATLAATAAAMVTTAALLAVDPPDLIPSGGEPGHFSSGARLAGSPSEAQADTDTERLAASQPSRPERAASRAVVSWAAHPNRPIAAVAIPARRNAGCVAPAVGGARFAAKPTPLAIAVQSP
jgi:hypothetical protein